LSFSTYMCAPCGRVRPGVQGGPRAIYAYGLRAPKIRLDFTVEFISCRAVARETLDGDPIKFFVSKIIFRFLVIRVECASLGFLVEIPPLPIVSCCSRVEGPTVIWIAFTVSQIHHLSIVVLLLLLSVFD
jgi:hypothetical protein